MSQTHVFVIIQFSHSSVSLCVSCLLYSSFSVPCSHLLTVSMEYTAVLQMETRSSWPLAQTWELGLALITFISLPSNLKATNSVFLCKSFQHNGIFLTMMITNGHSKHLSVRTAWHHLQTMLLLLVLALYQVDNLMTLWSHCGCTTQTVPLSRN